MVPASLRVMVFPLLLVSWCFPRDASYYTIVAYYTIPKVGNSRFRPPAAISTQHVRRQRAAKFTVLGVYCALNSEFRAHRSPQPRLSGFISDENQSYNAFSITGLFLLP